MFSFINLADVDNTNLIEICKTKAEEYRSRRDYLISLNSNTLSKHSIPHEKTITVANDDNSTFVPMYMSDLPSQLESKHLQLDLKEAMSLSSRAKEAESSGNLQKSFSLYMRCLEYYLRVSDEEENEYVKLNIQDTIKKILARSEDIKRKLIDKNQFVPEMDIPLSRGGISANNQTIYHPNKNLDTRIGTIEKETSTSFWNDSNPLFFKVKLTQNIVQANSNMALEVCITNTSSVEVRCIQMYLKKLNIDVSSDKKGNVNIKTHQNKVNKIKIEKPKTFPLGKGFYEEVVDYSIPEGEKSISNYSEYLLVIECDIPMHRNLSLEFPILII